MGPAEQTDTPMREARITGPSSFVVVTAPVPPLRSHGEILVRTALCGICSGDLMPWYLEKKVGTVLGHEVVGWVAEAGRAVEHVRLGDLVFLHHHAPCLECPACSRGDHVHCDDWRKGALDPGGMAEWIRVPTLNVCHDTFAVNDLTPEQAVFIEPLGCSVKALRRVRRVAGMPGVVVGCGVMGLLNLAVARVQGAGRLAAVEPDPQRRALALAFGADAVFTPEEAAAELAGAAEFVLVGPGHPDVIRQALGYVRPGGTALLFTPTAGGVMTPLDLGELYFREVSLVSSYSCGPEDTRQAYGLLGQGRVEVRPLVTHRFPLAEVQRAYDTARGGGAALKVLVTFDEESTREGEPEQL
jgi:L-iditol 2-dehydrogenase